MSDEYFAEKDVNTLLEFYHSKYEEPLVHSMTRYFGEWSINSYYDGSASVVSFLQQRSERISDIITVHK